MARLTLEPFGERHLPELEAMLDDPDLLRFTRIPDPPPEGFARVWLERYEAGRADGTRELFAGLGPDGELLGAAMAVEIDVVGRQAELGYLVAPAARGRGVATEMLGLLTRWAFEERGLERVELLIDVANAGSIQVARRCGYLHEGTLRSTFFKLGAPRADVTIWSRLASD
ncbi:MAG: acetyltransferase [Solirubrobacterales bacterium]|nr:acetyltransferase [Solirubrobacterales bacterium]